MDWLTCLRTAIDCLEKHLTDNRNRTLSAPADASAGVFLPFSPQMRP